jgi:hypothetical protein
VIIPGNLDPNADHVKAFDVEDSIGKIACKIAETLNFRLIYGFAAING